MDIIASIPVCRLVEVLLGYVPSYEDKLIELKEKAMELDALQERVVRKVKEAIRGGEVIEDEVERWLNRVDEVLQDADQLYNDPRNDSAVCSPWSFPNLTSRYLLSRQAEKLIHYLLELSTVAKGGFYHITKRHSEEFESRTLMKEKIVWALRDPNVTKIGIYGLGGVGKTHLAKEIAQLVKGDMYDVVCMTTVSQTPDVKRIQREIADQLNEETSTVNIAALLHERIKKEKSILIILDDVWEIIDLERLLGIPLAEGSCNLLLTSRNQHVLQKNETQKNFKVEVLDDAESGDDLVKATTLQDKGVSYGKDALRIRNENDYEKMERPIYPSLELSYSLPGTDEVKQLFLLCGVLGPSISVSGLLKYVIGLGVMKHVISIDDARSKLHRIIAGWEKSSLLLRCSAREVNVHDLICEVACSIASRHHNVFTMNASCKNWPGEDYLASCTQIILKHCHVQKLPKRLDCPNLYFLYLDTNDNHTLEIPDSFFEGMGNLQVLVLIGMTIPSLPTSLDSLAKLRTLCLNQCCMQDMIGIGALRSLEILSFLQSSTKEFPSEIGQLTNLRMLDLSSSEIEILPPKIISNLTKLEELYMGRSIKWGVESLAMQKENDILAELTCLTNLTALEIQIREAWILPRSIIFEKLETYNVVIGHKWEWSDSNGTSRLLKLNLDPNIHLEQEIKAIVKGVEDLYLEEVNGFSNVLYELNAEGFPLLKKLHIQNNTKIQHIVYSSERNQTHALFPNLETMILDNVNNLKKICHGPVAADLFKMLNHLTVCRCHKLKYLLHLYVLEDLQQLKTIDISDCASLEQVFVDEQAIQTTKPDAMDVLPLLHSLKLSNLPRLASLCSGAVHVVSRSLIQMTIENCPKFSFTFAYTLRRIEKQGPSKKMSKEMIVIPSELKNLNLQEVDVLKNMCEYPLFSLGFLTSLQLSNCNKLEYLFTLSMAQKLSSLQELKIISCRTIEQIVNRETKERANVVEFPQVKTLFLNDLPKFTGISNQDGSSVKWLALETVQVIECPNIKKSMLGMAHRPLLKNINVANCPPWEYEDLQSKIGYLFNLIDESSKLEILKIEDYKQLKNYMEMELQESSFTQLQTVEALQCDNELNKFLSILLHRSYKLDRLNIENCELLEQVFDLTEFVDEEQGNLKFPHLKTMQLRCLPKLKCIWNKDPRGIVGLGKLVKLEIIKCGLRKSPLSTSLLEKLVLLEELKIESCEMIEHVVEDDTEMHERSFSSLKNLQLASLPKLIKFNSGRYGFRFPSLEILKIEKCPELNAFATRFLSNQTLTNEGTSDHVKIETKERENVVEFPQVKTLILDHLPKFTGMSNQDGSRVKWLALETVQVTECPYIKKSMLGTVERPLLKNVNVANCPPWEYEDLESKIGYLFNLIDELSKLKILKIEDSKQLKNYMKKMQLQESSFTQLRTVEALQCDNELNKFLSCLLHRSDKLNRLTIENCELLEQVFDEEQGILNLPKLKTMQLLRLPKLKCIWNKNTIIASLGKLVKLEIIKCGLCMSPLPTSLLVQLYLLKELKIESCEMIEYVVEDDTERHCLPFPNLKKLQLASLPKLIKFKSGRCDFRFSSLKILKIEKCPELNAFTTGFLSNQPLTNEGTSDNVPSNERMHACPRLKELTLTDLKAVGVDSLRRLENLEILVVRHCSFLGRLVLPSNCSNLREIEVSSCNILANISTDPVQEKLSKKNFHNLKSIILENLKKLSIFSLETCEFPSLEKLRIVNCPTLVTLPRNVSTEEYSSLNKHSASLVLFDDIKEDSLAVDGQMKISPQLKSLELADLPNMQLWKQEPQIPVFQNLILLKIMRCRGIEKLFSISVAEHLSVLKFLKLYECTNMVQVLRGGGGNSKQVFRNLETLVLKHLPSLTSFCEDDVDFEEFPELNMVRVEDVPNMNTFVKKPLRTPKLKQVRVTFITKYWLGDLNETIKYLHENRDEVWECDQSSTRHHSDIAESSSRMYQTTQLGEKNFESDS